MTDDELGGGPALVPELLVESLATSLGFWRDICGFCVLYDRPAEGFAYIGLGNAHVMLEQVGIGRNWITAPLTRPLGRGVNLQISVPSTTTLLGGIRDAGWPLFMEPESRWYATADGDAGVDQFLVQDPDGYLIRFQSSLGRRPSSATPDGA